MPEHPGKQSNEGVDQHHRRQFTAGDDVVADRDLERIEFVDHPLVDPLVVSGDEEQPRFGGQFLDPGLGEWFALGREEHATGGRRLRRLHRVHRIPQGFAHHHHAGASAERSIVHGAMSVRRPFTKVVEVVLRGSAGRRSSGHAGREDFAKHVGKEREDVDAHRIPIAEASRRPRSGHSAADSMETGLSESTSSA